MEQIKNDQLTLEISSLGAELQSIKDANGNDLPKTVISREYSSEWKVGDEPYYPVNDEKNSSLYQKYKE